MSNKLVIQSSAWKKVSITYVIEILPFVFRYEESKFKVLVILFYLKYNRRTH